MAKKTTKKKTVKKAAPKNRVNKTAEIKKALAATPNKAPKDIAAALTAKGLNVNAGYVSTIKTNLKAEAMLEAPKKAAPKKVAKKTTKKKAAPKPKSVKPRMATKKRVAKKKVTLKKQASTAEAASGITYEQLLMVKEVAQQLGGAEKIKAALAALARLAK